MKRIALLSIIALLALSSCYKPESASHELGSEKNPLVMAFVPSAEAEQVMQSADELLEMLTEKTGLHFRANQATSYVGVVEGMAVGKVHIGWLPPMAYVLAHDRNGAQPVLKVVRYGRPYYRGQIVVKADSEIESVADLKGKLVSFPEPTSASGHYYPAALMMAEGLDPGEDIEVDYAGGHDAALIKLLKGQADAACCYDDARERLIDNGFEDIMDTTRILAYTEQIPADNVTVIDELAPELVDKLVAGLVAVAEDKAGLQVLDDLYGIEGLVPARDTDYDPVRQMAQALELDVAAEAAKGD
jgi:phosphonate transport system substrate-binding protein